MIADMLFLAKADHGLIIPAKARIDLEKDIHALCEFYGVLAEEKSVRLHVEGTGICHGDALMLRRAIGNLLSNAIRHALIDSTVSIRIATRPNSTEVSVSNYGDPISAEQLPRLFDRFYRADESRTRNDEGAGLGLAIARSIIASHGGTIDVSCSDGLARFTLSLPT
jgi:two-component system heavy metal sensor histidine kinase CusS